MRVRDPRKEKAIRLKTLDLVVREGLEGLSMQKIARAARVSPGTLYIYFKDRDDLLIQLYLEESEKAFAAMMTDFDPAMSFATGLRVQWLNRARFYMKHPQSMLFLEQFKYSPLYEKALEQGSWAFGKAMREFVQGAVRRGEIIRVPVGVYWSIAFAPLYQLVKYHLNGKSLPGAGSFVLTEPLLEQALALVLKALTPSPEERATE